MDNLAGSGSGSGSRSGSGHGVVYGGVVRWPVHPAADMHGLVRAVVRVRSRIQVARAVQAAGVEAPSASAWLSGIWAESKSQVERQATEGRWGELLGCGLENQYLKVENYRPCAGKKT